MSSPLRHLRPLPAPGRVPLLPPKYVVRSERCIACGQCIRSCQYVCHRRRVGDPRVMDEPESASCRGCFACVMDCPRGALEMRQNPDYEHLCDPVYTAQVIRSIQEQAATGKIPVSGAGYGGPFDGRGFDGIWTDMSEIVRPTRDGIHGREAISTLVDLGRKIPDLCGLEFDGQGSLLSPIPPTREIAIPILFGALPFAPPVDVLTPLAVAARALATYQTVLLRDHPERLREYYNHLIIRMAPSDVGAHWDLIEWATIVEMEWDREAVGAIAEARRVNPHLLTIIRVPVAREAPQRVLQLAEAGAECIHLCADWHGHGEKGVTLVESLRGCHLELVEKGLRDQVTLLASGGIAMAEHLPKAIILGADAVFIDVPLLVALECTVCGSCLEGRPCPRRVGEADIRWSATRVVNLMLSWRDQLLEVLGAMGMRDVRRLRGEAGRAIFADSARTDFVGRLALGSASGGYADEPQEPTCEMRWHAVHSGAPDRFANVPSLYRVVVERQRCTDCGLCVHACPYGVFRRSDGKVHLDEPAHHRCIGPECLQNSWCCVHICPWQAPWRRCSVTFVGQPS